MTFGEKLKEIRRIRNLSQAELAQMTGISERSLYTYEQLGTVPRQSNIRKIAEALQIPVEELTTPTVETSETSAGFVAEAHKEFGSKGAREAESILDRAGALFAGGDLDEEAKDVFFRALMEVYMDSKRNAREKFTPKKHRDADDREDA